MNTRNEVTIIGAGPSGLFCAYELLKNNFTVHLYERNPAVGRKFLIAGKGGLNLTHSEELESFVKRYGKDQSIFKSLLSDFSNSDLRKWCQKQNIETFIGSSGRVFPKKFNAADFLITWFKNIRSFKNFHFYPNHQFINLFQGHKVEFLKDKNQKISTQPQIIIFALGGASWKQTGSDGLWRKIFLNLEIETKDFLPMNCGFKHQWSSHFINKVNRHPIKNIGLKFQSHSVKGELMITEDGLEGGAIYALSNYIRDEISSSGLANISIDLKPDLTIAEILSRLDNKKNKDTLKSFLKKKLKIDEASYQLFIELTDKNQYSNAQYLADNLKNLSIQLTKVSHIDRAISTSGGIDFKALNSNLESKKISNIYFCGEMLDFEAPTGGYLLQGCFSTASRVIKSILIKSK